MNQEEQLAFLFGRIGKEFKKSFSNTNLKIDCSHKDMRILEYLYSGPKTMKELANEIGLTPGSMTSAIDKLVSSKYVKRIYDKEDRRKVSIELLQKGNAIAEHMNKFSLEIAKKLLNSLPKEERKIMISLIEKSIKGLN